MRGDVETSGRGVKWYGLNAASTTQDRSYAHLFPSAPPNHELTEELICRLIRRSPLHKLLEIRLITFGLACAPIIEPLLERPHNGSIREWLRPSLPLSKAGDAAACGIRRTSRRMH